MYTVKDCKTGQIVARCATERAARNKAARMNAAYGACRYTANGIAY